MKTSDVKTTKAALVNDYQEQVAATKNCIADSQRGADPLPLAEAQVHATLALAAATMLIDF